MTTTAAALAAGSTLGSFSGADRPEALFVLSALAGVMMIAAGVLALGSLHALVSVSVLTGFLSGVAAAPECSARHELSGGGAAAAVVLGMPWPGRAVAATTSTRTLEM